MSDSFMYELDDIVWDEFGQAEDHIVPHPSEEHANEHSLQSNSFKKPRHEVTDISTNAIDNCPPKCINQEKDRDILTVNKRRNSMLEKDHWSNIHNVFSDSCDDTDPIQEAGNLLSDSNRMISRCFKNNNMNSINGELCADDLILSHRRTAVDTGIFNNDCVDKESNDLIYYGWPDIGNFEDVDGMFRNCDSSFGLGDAGNQDDLGWFSSSEAIEGSEDPMKSDFKFPCPDSITLNSISEKSAVIRCGGSRQLLNVDEQATVGHLSLMNGSDQKLAPHSSDYVKTNAPYLHSDYSLPSDQTTINPTISGFNSESKGSTSLSPKVSHDPFNDKRKKQNGRQGFQKSFTSNNVKHVDSVIQYSICDPVSVQKEFQHCGNKLQNRSNIEELCSVNVKENSSMNSRPEDISLEASSFCQLQQVMEQLDLRTKLCIRDSLFRLARSAEQRHNYANLNGSSDSSSAFIAAGSTKCTGFMDMETDTNPIDRSIAHLLFHRPLDSSTRQGHNVLPLKSHLRTKIHESMTSMPAVMDQKVVCNEESAVETGRKAADQ